MTQKDIGCKAPPVELEGVDELSERVFRAYMATLRLHRRHMMKAFGDCGMHPGQAICLHLIAVHESTTQRDLTELLHLSRPTVSRMLRTMEKAGLVERCADRGDQRLTRVSLTAAGRRAELEQRAVGAAVVNGTIGTMSEKDRRELARLLEALAASHEAALAASASGAAGPVR